MIRKAKGNDSILLHTNPALRKILHLRYFRSRLRSTTKNIRSLALNELDLGLCLNCIRHNVSPWLHSPEQTCFELLLSNLAKERARERFPGMFNHISYGSQRACILREKLQEMAA